MLSKEKYSEREIGEPIRCSKMAIQNFRRSAVGESYSGICGRTSILYPTIARSKRRRASREICTARLLRDMYNAPVKVLRALQVLSETGYLEFT